MDPSDAEVGHLSRLDDRRSEPYAQGAIVVEREGPACELLRAQAPLARCTRQLGDLDGQLGDLLGVSVVDDGDDQPIGGRGRDADVELTVQGDLLALDVDRRVDVWMPAQGLGGDPQQQRGDRERAAELFVLCLLA